MGKELGWTLAMPLQYSGALLILAAIIVIAVGATVMVIMFKGIERLGQKDPVKVAKMRLARGEISEEEFKTIAGELSKHKR